jgi:hypothetical protein
MMPFNATTGTRRELGWVALALAALAALALRPSIHGIDGTGNYVWLPSLLIDRDVDFSNEYRAFDAARDYPFSILENSPIHPVTGRPANRFGVGSAILWSPFVAATHLWLRSSAPERADGIGRPYESAVGIGTACWGSLGLLLLYRRLRRGGWGVAVAAGTLAGLLLATPLGFYLYAHGSMSHGVGFFAAVALMLALDAFWRAPRPATAAALGAAAALLAMIRFQDAPWVIVAAGALGWRLWLSGGRLPRPAPGAKRLAAIFLLTAGVVFLPQLSAWRALYGTWWSGPLPYLDAEAGGFDPWPRHAFAALFSERGGVLAWHPLYLIGLIGLVRLARREGTWTLQAWIGLIGFGGLTWLVGCWSIWWAGASFGNRFFIGALPWIALGVAPWLGGVSLRQRRIAWAALALLIVWNAGLLAQYATEMIPREAAVPWSRVIRQNVIDVPRWLIERLRDS